MMFPIILILGGLFFLSSDMGIIRWYQLRRENNKIQLDIELLIVKEKELTIELDRLKNDEDYIKKIAQERFYMVNPGEKVFHVIDRRKTK